MVRLNSPFGGVAKGEVVEFTEWGLPIPITAYPWGQIYFAIQKEVLPIPLRDFEMDLCSTRYACLALCNVAGKSR